MAGLFEHHHRTRFEVTAFAFGPKTIDATQERIAKAVIASSMSAKNQISSWPCWLESSVSISRST